MFVIFIAVVPAASAKRPASSKLTTPLLDVQQVSKPHMRFGAAAVYDSGGPYTGSVAIADVNGDGIPDLVVANNCQSTDFGSCDAPGEVAVLLGNSDGTFQPAVTYGSGANYAYSVAVADVNGDGHPDLVVTNACQDVGGGFFCVNGSPGQVGVLLGNGDGTFQPAVTYDSGGLYADALAIKDVNGDGRPDLVVANSGAPGADNGSVSVLLGNGDGTFQGAFSYNSAGYSADSVAVGDLNGDGYPDLVALNWCATNSCDNPDSNGEVGVLLGNGDGTFQPAMTYSSGGSYAYSVSVKDLNGDGLLDLAIANRCQVVGGGQACPTPNVVDVLLGNGDGTFQPAVTYAAGGTHIDSLVIGDVNGDGYPDLVVVNECQRSSKIGDCVGTGQVGVLLGNGDGSFQTPVKFSSGGYAGSSVAVGDVNGDGRPDIVVTNAYGSNYNNYTGSVAVLLNETSYGTQTTLRSSTNPSQINQTVTFTATITSNPSLPNGETVTFYIGKTKLGTGVTSNGLVSLSTSFAKPGTYSIKAKYSGDAFRKASSGLMTQMVNP